MTGVTFSIDATIRCAKLHWLHANWRCAWHVSLASHLRLLRAKRWRALRRLWLVEIALHHVQLDATELQAQRCKRIVATVEWLVAPAQRLLQM